MIRKELKALVKAVETKVGKSIPISSDFEKLAQIFSKYHISLQPLALKKVWTYVTGAEMMTDKQIMMYSPYLVDIHFSFISLQLSV